MGFNELLENANVLLIAGSETTATLLSGCLFLLGSNPDKLAKVVDEVRTEFTKEEEITLNSVSHLPYMLAVLNESLRCYPPVGGCLPRVVPKGGGYINGKFVPQGVSGHILITFSCKMIRMLRLILPSRPLWVFGSGHPTTAKSFGPSRIASCRNDSLATSASKATAPTRCNRSAPGRETALERSK